MKLEGKSALITGGSRGIGFEIARVFLEEGAKVLISSRNEVELSTAKKSLEKEHKNIHFFTADVSRPDECRTLAKKAAGNLGGIDILVNAAGIYGPIGPSDQVDIAKWRETYEINVFGTFQMIQAVLPFMAEKDSGKIINFSGGGDGPLPNFSAYNSSKGAIVRLTETIAAELKADNIQVNCIAPGPVNTKFLDQALAAGEAMVGNEKFKELLKQKSEGGVSPEVAAKLCLFLASSESRDLTGKFLSAVWDDYGNWSSEDIEKLNQSDALTLRRVKWQK